MGHCAGGLVTMSEDEKIGILKEILGYYSREGTNQLLFKCPSCDHHKKKLSVNIEKGLFKCWVCDWSGRNLYKILRRYGSYHQKQTWRRFDQQTDINHFAEKLFGIEESTTQQKINLPPGFVSLANLNLPSTASRAANYLESRAITKKDILKGRGVKGFEEGGEVRGMGRAYMGTSRKAKIR